MLPPPNWYPDPGNPQGLRYWDGAAWTENVAPMWPAPAPLREYRPARHWAVLTCVLAVVVAVARSVEAAVSWAGLDTGAMSDDGLTRYVVVSIAVLGLQVLAYPFACLWLWQARENAEALNPGSRHVRSRGWIWGSWVTPPVFFWFPFQIVRDVRDATRPQGAGGGLVGWWWLLWVGFWILDRATTFFGYGSDDLAAVETWGALFCVLAAAAWVNVVRQISREQLSAAREAAPAPARTSSDPQPR